MTSDRNTPKIQALGITQEGSSTRWKATGYVEGVGWLEAWGTTLIAAMEAVQVLAAQRVAQRGEEAPMFTTRHPVNFPNKVIVIDGEIVIGGSFNYTKAAQDKNAENVEITRDKGLASKYMENWQAHAQHSEAYMGRGVAR